MNICLCGAEAGYPHADDCPRPLYRGSDRQIEEWHRQREAKRIIGDTGYAVAEGEERGPWRE